MPVAVLDDAGRMVPAASGDRSRCGSRRSANGLSPHGSPGNPDWPLHRFQHSATGCAPEERYVLGNVRKLKSGQWLFQARIQYGEHDLTLPLTLPIVWAGDTPVIQVDSLPIPGLGTFTARVMIHQGCYAGYWAPWTMVAISLVASSAASKSSTPAAGSQ